MPFNPKINNTDGSTLLESDLLKNLQDPNIQIQDSILVLGVSGGPDSTALLSSIVELKSELNISIRVVYVDHGLRYESIEEGKYVSSICANWDIPFRSIKVDTLDHQANTGLSIEEAARDLRYSSLLDAAISWGAQHIAVAHTLDDQVETIMMNILRGTSLNGLGGMQLISPVPIKGKKKSEPDIKLIRPFLTIKKESVLKYLELKNIHPKIDSSNSSSQFSRNRVRNELIPLMEDIRLGSSNSIIRTTKSLRTINSFLKQESTQKLTNILISRNNDQVSLNRILLRNYHLALQIKILQNIVASLLGSTEGFSYKNWINITNLISKGSTGKSIPLPHNIFCTLTAKTLIVSIGSSECPLPRLSPAELNKPGNTHAGEWLFNIEETNTTMTITGSSRIKEKSPEYLLPREMIATFDKNKLGKLKVRSRANGDRINLNYGTKKLKTLFIDSYIPRGWRNNIPVIYDSLTGEIIWVVGVKTIND